jgi:phosphatidylinositol 4-kinase
MLVVDNQQNPRSGSDHEIEDVHAIFTVLERRVGDRKFIAIGELQDILRRAAALLCRSKQNQCAIIHHVVQIPFTIFTKQAIKLGISLWLGIINENPRMEPRILVEIAEHWNETVLKKIGIFDDKFQYVLLPFFILRA